MLIHSLDYLQEEMTWRETFLSELRPLEENGWPDAQPPAEWIASGGAVEGA